MLRSIRVSPINKSEIWLFSEWQHLVDFMEHEDLCRGKIKGLRYVSMHNFMGQMESTQRDPWHSGPDYQKYQTLKPISVVKPLFQRCQPFLALFKESISILTTAKVQMEVRRMGYRRWQAKRNIVCHFFVSAQMLLNVWGYNYINLGR